MVLRVRRRDVVGFAPKERANEPRSCVGRKVTDENHNVARPEMTGQYYLPTGFFRDSVHVDMVRVVYKGWSR